MTWRPLVPASVRPGSRGAHTEEEFWQNDKYFVAKRVMKANDPNHDDMIYLSIRNQDRSVKHDWRDFQRIKNQLAGPEWEGLEIYPAESRLVDGANQYHIWCFPFKLGFGFNRRLVGNAYQAALASPGAVQRDPEQVDLQYGGLTPLKEMLEDFPYMPKPKEAP